MTTKTETRPLMRDDIARILESLDACEEASQRLTARYAPTDTAERIWADWGDPTHMLWLLAAIGLQSHAGRIITQWAVDVAPYVDRWMGDKGLTRNRSSDWGVKDAALCARETFLCGCARPVPIGMYSSVRDAIAATDHATREGTARRALYAARIVSEALLVAEYGVGCADECAHVADLMTSFMRLTDVEGVPESVLASRIVAVVPWSDIEKALRHA